MTEGPTSDRRVEEDAGGSTHPRRERTGVLRRTFLALHTRNYRLFFIGQIVSQTGTWMQRVGQDWLILELGGGPLELSFGLALQSGPVLLFGVWGGLIADRVDIRRLLFATQTAFAILALTLGLLTVTGTVRMWIVYVMAFGLGCTTIFDKPARHAFMVELVTSEGAANAVSLNSSINNAARLVGPALVAILIGLTSTGVAFLVNAATFAAIILALLMMDASAMQPRETAQPGRGQVREGIRSSMANPELRTPLLATLILSTLAQNFRLTLPLMAVSVFGRGVGGYGLLMSTLGAGALLGALACANLARPSQRLAGMAALSLGVLLLIAAVSPTYAVLAILVFGVGVGSTAFNATSQTLLLLRSDPDKRGRIMGLRELFSNGFTPAGTLAIGWVCAVFSPRTGLAVGGVAAVFAAGLMFRDRTISKPGRV